MEIKELVKIVQPYSMASPERLRWIATAAKAVIEQGIPGDFVECGVCNGGSAAILAHYAALGRRRVHLFDSFEGLPAIGPNDVPSVTGHWADKEVGRCVGSIEKVKEVIHKATGLELAPISFYPGWFHETFKYEYAQKIEQIAMLNLDSDWYASEKLCWETWYPKMTTGGFIYVDDYYYWPGCKKAADEYLADKLFMAQKVGHSLGISKVNVKMQVIY